MTKYLRWVGLGGGLAAVAILGFATRARSADHLDSPATIADPAADINDLYTWMDTTNVVFAMTLFPAANAHADAGALAKFSNTVQYVFHTSSGASFGATTKNYDIICTFDATQKISCWGGTDHFVTGDASQAAGLASADGKFKVFAGLRADPFFFNAGGFKDTVAQVEAASGSLVFNAAGCPAIDAPTSAALVKLLTHSAGGTTAPVDTFANFNALAIVVSVDKSLVTAGGAIVGVWASTNVGQ